MTPVSAKAKPAKTGAAIQKDLELANEYLTKELEELKESEAHLRLRLENERISGEVRLRSFIEAVSQGILVVSAKGVILLVNRRIEEMFGYDRQELVGQNLEVLLPERYRRSHVAHRLDYFGEPRVRPMGAGMNLRGRRKDGTEFPAEIGLSHMDTGQGLMAIGLVSDITERKRAEDELARVNEELRVTNAELEQFAYVASHDLQEPLRMISSYLQLLERRYSKQLDHEAHEFIAFAVDGSARMKVLIQDLLSFSRAGRRSTQFRLTAGDTILQGALANLKAAIAETNAQVTWDPLPEIFADPTLLLEVFQNLIGNALKFRREESPKIHMSASRQDDSWVFSVRDNGIGIPREHADRIFRIFERLHNDDKYPGTGIGLAVAQKIVERHAGKIWFESQLGIGTTFYFSLPEHISVRQALEGAAKA